MKNAEGFRFQKKRGHEGNAFQRRNSPRHRHEEKKPFSHLAAETKHVKRRKDCD